MGRTKLPASSYIMRSRVFSQFLPARSASYLHAPTSAETKHSDTTRWQDGSREGTHMSLCRRSPSAISWQGWSIIGAGGMIQEKAGSVPAAACSKKRVWLWKSSLSAHAQQRG